MSEDDGFIRLAEPFRPELLVHCYRMLGSVHDAEDLVQETYLRAWRGYDRFEGRSSLRTWLYRIATSACLTALEHRSRRFLPSGLGLPAEGPDAEFPVPAGGWSTPDGQVHWVQPLPDAAFRSDAEDPADIASIRGSVRLALVAALQHLPPRQRAVLILRDVLGWRAAEVAELLETSTTAVNSALLRARAQLAAMAPDEDDPVGPLDDAHRQLLDRYVAAFETADIHTLVLLLKDDVSLEMPPEPAWFHGQEDVGRFIAERIMAPAGELKLVLTAANGQPAMADYRRHETGEYRLHAIVVLSIQDHLVSRIVAFRDPALLSMFELPMRLPALATPAT